MTETTYHQCKLRQGSSVTVGWIEARGAKKGAQVELKPFTGFWDVVEVFGPPMDESQMREHQRMHRRSLPSIEAMV